MTEQQKQAIQTAINALTEVGFTFTPDLEDECVEVGDMIRRLHDMVYG